jgi:hypothetical protein
MKTVRMVSSVLMLCMIYCIENEGSKYEIMRLFIFEK